MSIRKDILEEIESYSKLEDNWDHDGSVKNKLESLQDTINFVNMCPEQMLNGVMVCLHSDGEYSLEWIRTMDGGNYASMQFLGKGKIAFYTESNGIKAKGMIEAKLAKIQSTSENNG